MGYRLPASDLSFFRLRVLLTVARAGSVTRAAELLHLSQPAVSQHLREAERYFGQPLFERSSHGVRATAAGDQACAAAERLVSELDAVRSMIRGHVGLRRRIVLAASTTVANYILSGLLQQFQLEHPDAEFVVHVLTKVQAVEEVLSRMADVGYVVAQRYPVAIVAESMAEVALIVVAAPGHPLARRKQVPVAALARQRLVVPSRGSPHRDASDAKLRELHIQPPIAAEFGSAEAMKHAVEAGLGIGFFSHYTVARELAEGRLVRLPVRHRALRHKIDLIYRADTQFAGLLVPFLAFLRGNPPAIGALH